jgi:hypothetical protein
MATQDSRHNFKVPRWAISAGDVDSGNATEPSSGQKDVGWEPGVDSVNGRWWNWLHQQAGVFLTYIENVWDRRWTEPQVMRSSKGTSQGDVTAGVGLSVDVAACQVWIDGAMYQVPAATNLALATADPTDPRDDLVVAELSGGVPEFAVITGTPDPSTPDPTAGAGQVPIALVRVGAAATAPGTITSRREYGVLEVDRLGVDDTLYVGADGRTLKVLDGANPAITLFDNTTGLASLLVKNGAGDAELTWVLGSGPILFDLPGAFDVTTATDVLLDAGDDVIVTAADDITLTAGGTLTISPPSFATDITQRIELAADALRYAGGDLVVYTGGTYASDAPQWTRTSAGEGYLRASVTLPIGAIITTVRVWGEKTTTDAHVRMRLVAITKTTNSRTNVFSTDNDGATTGDFVLSQSSVNYLVASGETLFLDLMLDGDGGAVSVWAAEVTYTFDELAGG